MKEISLELCKREGKKVSLSKAQIDEVLGHLSDLVYESCQPCFTNKPFRVAGVIGTLVVALFLNGERRANRKRPRKEKAQRDL